MLKVAVVYFSGYGHTAKQANAVIQGVQSLEGAQTYDVAIDSDGQVTDQVWSELEQADAIIFGCPTYMGCIPWQFKRFADASSKIWANQGWRDKIAAGFTNSGSMNGDKHSTLTYLFTFSMQHSMLWVGTGLMPANKSVSQRDDVNYLGAFSGAMAQSPADLSADDAPGPGDLSTARIFGQRIAQAADRWKLR